MIKDSRYIIRRVIIGVLISLILSFIYACDVKALTNYTQSIDVNYNVTDNVTDVAFYNDANHTNKAFANAGRGYMIGIILAYRYSETTSGELPTIESINARTDSGYSTCEVSSLTNNNSASNDNMKATMYGFKCDLLMGTNGIISLSANFRPQVNNAFTKQLYRLTFNNNLQAEEVAYEEYVYQYMQDWIYPRLNGIENNTGTTATEIRWIYEYLQNYIYSKLGGIESAINNQSSQAHNDSQAEIESANQNTQDTIESQQVCNYIDKNSIEIDDKFLDQNGNLSNGSDWGITKYYKLNKNTKITRKVISAAGQNARYCFYNVNRTLISCYSNLNQPVGIITIPTDVSYVRFSIQKSVNRPQFEICNNGNQATNDSINDVNDTLNNSNVSIDTLPSDNINMGPISSLVTLPITALNNIVNAFNGSCTPFNIGSLLGTNLVFPCINIESLIGSFLWNTIDIIVTGIFIFSIRQRFVDLFYKLVTLKDIGLKGGF